MAILSYYACVNLHRDALRKVFHAPMSFFDTTVRRRSFENQVQAEPLVYQPLGRILGVLGKDIDSQSFTVNAFRHRSYSRGFTAIDNLLSGGRFIARLWTVY